ncbi:DUF3667 domain-containing protein [Undibacterium sp. RTI2.1]|uniref:DUF3667 domain-containing protein n=1 Tax=unclassified Undibacterium TaxID=2630295 RepID=UPI002B226283|nr:MULTISPECIES: DUF3667 domain-containing protein [unclassified Undibacterium]MEB0031407.1 DUF3667 domain-containing protein [Undibacterium sp. RTI2.1]MEB0117762.1 DUF3667 domain-containing protein [Undibacterium sp. RTI2.2]
MTSSHHHSTGYCANCDHPAPKNFCPACGQKTHIETPTLWEFIHEYLHHYIALEGTLTRTLWMLIAHPGRLTAEYVAGRRQRYIKPLQLYLTMSFIFFVLFGLFGHLPVSGGDIEKAQTANKENVMKELMDDPDEDVAAAATGIGIGIGNVLDPLKANIKKNSDTRKAGQSIGESGVLQEASEESAASEVVEKSDASVPPKVKSQLGGSPAAIAWVKRAGKRFKEYQLHPEETRKELGKEALHKAPYAVFVLMPVFAFLLWLVYFRRHLVYGIHLVLAFHLHAFTFLLFLLLMIPFVPSELLTIGFLVYFVIALRQVYHGRWLAQILRALMLMGLYLICVGIALCVLFVTLI